MVDATLTATGHRVGRRYFSLSHLASYHVVASATTWELAPGASVILRWENGNVTTSALHRGGDPELCTACDGVVQGPSAVAVKACTCDGP